MPVSARSHGRQAALRTSVFCLASSQLRLEAGPRTGSVCIFYEGGRAGQQPKGGSILRAENIEGEGY